MFKKELKLKQTPEKIDPTEIRLIQRRPGFVRIIGKINNPIGSIYIDSDNGDIEIVLWHRPAKVTEKVMVTGRKGFASYKNKLMKLDKKNGGLIVKIRGN